MGCSLHDFGHGHGHGGGHNHSHSHTKEPTLADPGEVSQSNHKRTAQQNMNVRAAIIHVISDFVQSCGVFIAALVIYFKPEWGIIDPICTFLFSILVLATTLRIMKDAVLVSTFISPHKLRLPIYLEVSVKRFETKGAKRRCWKIFRGN